MKNIYLLLCAMLLALGVQAQTKIAGDLITVSETSEYWYYIGNGHNMGAINDNDGRYCSMITAPATTTAAVTYQSILNNLEERKAQKWKVVESGETDFYYLINKEGKYLTHNSSRCFAVTEAPKDANGDSYKFQFIQTIAHTDGTASTWVTIKRKGGNYLGGLNQGSDFVIESNNASAPGAIIDNGTTKNPRAWHFTEEAVFDKFYPNIADQGATAPNEWFRIKSLDKTITNGAEYLSVDANNVFSIEAKADSDNQLFGFVSAGYDSSKKSYTIKIVSKATGKFFGLNGSALTTGDSGTNWVLKHTYSTNNSENPYQAVLRNSRYGTASIITNEVPAALAEWSSSSDNFDNKFAWAFERTPFDVAVDAKTGVALSTADAASIYYDDKFTISYTVDKGTTPVVTVNNEPSSFGDLKNGVYTLSLTITEKTYIVIEAVEPQNEITFSLAQANGVTITSPKLEGNKFTASDVLSVEYTLDEGYTIPEVTAGESVIVGDATLKEGKYTFVVTNITGATTLTFTNSVITYDVTLPESGNGINVITTETTADYLHAYKFTYNLANGYNYGAVFINGVYARPVENADGSFSVTMSEVRNDLVITAKAFILADNIIPATIDTYVSGRNPNDKFADEAILFVQYETDSYARRSYVEFEIPDNIAVEGYDRVLLKLTFKSRQKDKSGNPAIEVRTVSTDTPLVDMTWSVNGEQPTAPKGEIVSKPFIFDRTLSQNTQLMIDVTDYVIDKTGNVKLQISGHSLNEFKGNVFFYSIEGALDLDKVDYVPALVFEKSETLTWQGADADWNTASNWDNNTVPRSFDNVIIPSGYVNPTIPVVTIESLTLGSDVEVNNTMLKLTKNITVDKTVDKAIWYPTGFPFEATAHYLGDKNGGFGDETELIYEPGEDTPSGDFWVKSYNATTDVFDYTEDRSFAVNKGYIVQYPGFFDGETITFKSTEDVFFTSEAAVTATTSYALVANPRIVAMTVKQGDVVEEGSSTKVYYYKYDATANSFLRATTGDNVTFAPFESFVVVTSESETGLKSIIDGDEDLTSINVVEGRSDIKEVRYYNLQGLEINKPSVNDKAMYIEKTIYKSGEEKSVKRINK
ncbi:hypothetical protein M2138_000441 [Dysgonomonadaceae bacterium PH5-43]|nr:hypothetical protein [Dysgonomonadaceae bacterium PH5-43]